ncbi:hypothetical protein RM844_14270 [Streptomyces sp. DSM 44915]|uniref:Uncharacterized protein n=1 Tax=Streptomyces chisholmiae TaxID=3075540 RepID=A0ABU2JR43_9ACTN|nr:hypothetical protein [Streptomyces sp. DSM 44915]MDT0267453.1 hypothetical protein [Streptomyces sp. DSM 44915]
MDLVSLISAAVALGSATVAGVLGYWTQRRLRGFEQRTVMESYGASLVWAAYDLQSRLFNILYGHAVDVLPEDTRHGFLTSFHRNGSPGERAYVSRSTVFVIAEYLGWVEILRRDVRYLDLGSSRTNRAIMAKIAEVDKAFNRSSAQSNVFRVFRAHQRAIGELMIHPDGAPGERRCLGYAEFCEKLDTDDRFSGWFTGLLADVDALTTDTAPAVPRLTELQHGLTDLITLLDPKGQQVPEFRSRFQGVRPAGEQ